MDGSTPAPATPYSDLTRDELEAQITELAGQLNAANYRWLRLIAEFDRRQGVSVLCSQAERARHAGDTFADMGVSTADMGVSAETPVG